MRSSTVTFAEKKEKKRKKKDAMYPPCCGTAVVALTADNPRRELEQRQLVRGGHGGTGGPNEHEEHAERTGGRRGCFCHRIRIRIKNQNRNFGRGLCAAARGT